ncbi:hypothetical protein FVE85_3596 [Porphyridium purpureum]|uniref:Uncharacterized protein n=1 Tax=Porphyridium purpureum TaxID=35688 RepID=A0A5J4YLN6_PORPP|nr:hypothetical protein FVE85_3596 [Porphyridium purpureum]|eukprot:POR2266..scf249_10
MRRHVAACHFVVGHASGVRRWIHGSAVTEGKYRPVPAKGTNKLVWVKRVYGEGHNLLVWGNKYGLPFAPVIDDNVEDWPMNGNVLMFGPLYAIWNGRDMFRGIVFRSSEYRRLVDGVPGAMGRPKATIREAILLFQTVCDYLGHVQTPFYAFRCGVGGTRGFAFTPQLVNRADAPSLQTQEFSNATQALVYCEQAGTSGTDWLSLERSVLYLMNNQRLDTPTMMSQYYVHQETGALPSGPPSLAGDVSEGQLSSSGISAESREDPVEAEDPLDSTSAEQEDRLDLTGTLRVADDVALFASKQSVKFWTKAGRKYRERQIKILGQQIGLDRNIPDLARRRSRRLFGMIRALTEVGVDTSQVKRLESRVLEPQPSPSMAGEHPDTARKNEHMDVYVQGIARAYVNNTYMRDIFSVEPHSMYNAMAIIQLVCHSRNAGEPATCPAPDTTQNLVHQSAEDTLSTHKDDGHTALHLRSQDECNDSFRTKVEANRYEDASRLFRSRDVLPTVGEVLSSSKKQKLFNDLLELEAFVLALNYLLLRVVNSTQDSLKSITLKTRSKLCVSRCTRCLSAWSKQGWCSVDNVKYKDLWEAIDSRLNILRGRCDVSIERDNRLPDDHRMCSACEETLSTGESAPRGPFFAIWNGRTSFFGIVIRAWEMRALGQGVKFKRNRGAKVQSEKRIIDAVNVLSDKVVHESGEVPCFYAFRDGLMGARGYAICPAVSKAIALRVAAPSLEKRLFPNATQAMVFCELAETNMQDWHTLADAVLFLVRNPRLNSVSMHNKYFLQNKNQNIPKGPLRGASRMPGGGESAARHDIKRADAMSVVSSPHTLNV